MLIEVTGSSAFIGRALYAELVERGVSVRGVVRSLDVLAADHPGVEFVPVGEIGAETDWVGVWIPACTGMT